MLSKNDIQKELGKGINVYPLHIDNIKENSINFTISQNAWTLGEGAVLKVANGKYIFAKVPDKNAQLLKKGDSAIISEKNRKYLILLPNSTTIVETSEVLGVENYIGGTLHSKVGIVAQGVGDIGTMLGPCFSGHLMLSLHNITNEVIVLRVGETFVSLIFYYLDTPSKCSKNTNMSGHVDKLSELGIKITQPTREYLTDDWKQTVDGIRKKMLDSDTYKLYEKERKKERKKIIFEYLNVRNFLTLVFILGVIVLLGVGANKMDIINETSVWSDRFWTTIIAGVFVPIFMKLGNFFNKKNN